MVIELSNTPPSSSSLLRGRRCLYCQRLGCPGLNSCWRPRIQKTKNVKFLNSNNERNIIIIKEEEEEEEKKYNINNKNNNYNYDSNYVAPRSLSADPSHYRNNNNNNNNKGNVIEENLRAQIRVLEREVELLRNGFRNVANIGSNMKMNRNLNNNNSNNNNNMNKDKTEVGTMTSDVSYFTGDKISSSHTGIPSYIHDFKKEEKEKEEYYNNKTEVSHELERVKGLEELVRELASQNASLCQNLAEMNIIVEQREALLRSLITTSHNNNNNNINNHNNKLNSSSTPIELLSNISKTTTTFEQKKDRETVLLNHLLQSQEEVAHLREEIRQVKLTLEITEKKLKQSLAEVERLEEKQQNIELISAKTKTNSDNNNIVKETSNMNTSITLVEINNLREQLASAERKVLAWETWYRQQQEQQKEKVIINNSSKDNIQYSSIEIPQQKQKEEVILQTQPISHLSNSYNSNNIFTITPSLYYSGKADALAIDTYALIAREAALREVAAKEREDIMSALMLKEKEEINENENISKKEKEEV